MFDVSFVYKIVDKFSGPARKIQDSANKTKGAVSRMGEGARNMGRRFQGAGEKLRGMANVSNIASSALANFAIILPTKRAMEFESAVANLDKAFDFQNAGSRASFVKDLRDMAPSLGLTATAAANLAFEAGKLGIAQEEVKGFVKEAAQASVAFDGLAIEDAGQIIGDLKTRFGLAIEGVGGMLDAVNSLADGTTRNGGEILNVLGRLSGQFASLEFPPELAAGFSTFARQIAVSDELASSGMKMFLRELDQTKLAAAPLDTIREKLEQLGQLSIADRASVIETQFGKEAATFVQGMVANLDTLGETMAIVADKTSFAGSKQREFNVQAGTSAFQAKAASAQFDNLMITIGERLIPVLKNAIGAFGPIVEKVTRFVEQNPNVVKMAAAFVAVSTAVLGLAAGVGLIMALVSPVGLLVAGVVGLGAAITMVWDDFKAFLSDVTGPFKGLADGVRSFMNLTETGLSKVGDFFGFGNDTTIADPTGTAGALSVAPAAAGGEAGPVGALSGGGQANRLDGQINIGIDGPGKVLEAQIGSDAPGNLGANIGNVR